MQIIADTLKDRGALSPDEKEVILQLYNYREKVELCLGTVMVSGPNSYTTICEVLRDCGYGHIVESLKADDEESDKCKYIYISIFRSFTFACNNAV